MLCRIVTLITLYVNKILDNVLLYVTLEYMAQIDRNKVFWLNLITQIIGIVWLRVSNAISTLQNLNFKQVLFHCWLDFKLTGRMSVVYQIVKCLSYWTFISESQPSGQPRVLYCEWLCACYHLQFASYKLTLLYLIAKNQGCRSVNNDDWQDNQSNIVVCAIEEPVVHTLQLRLN